ncbi:hypothetical protein [Alienimonas chondri]|uniref:Ankyrin repeat domain-containing protein n=1 Tax=Alienimonas chondri TaxID=2681879 RepID=A0ABX1VHI2_9PLAN|nr:hypothetical protein [Alienimonas chondri]NNJ27303.1 hypothetical protein [Alienimonas chondri]
MSVFDFPTPGAASGDLLAQKRRVQDYVREASDPNEAGENGRTLLTLALLTCFEGQGEELVVDLLRRGADPNRPSAWANFTSLLTVSCSLPLVREFVDAGLRLNDVYRIDGQQTGGLLAGPCTVLNYADAVRDSIAPKRKTANQLADRYAGGLGPRRRFIDESIALLESSGAERAVRGERPSAE